MASPHAQDYWQSQAAQIEVAGSDDGLSQVGSPSFGGRSSKVLTLLLGMLILALGGFLAHSMVEGGGEGEESDFVTMIVGSIDSFFASSSEVGDEAADESAPPTTPSDDASEGDTAPEMIEPAEKTSEVAGNPYWALPNTLSGITTPTQRWSPDEETAIRAGLTHKFRYQRLKTIQDLRKSPLLGSEAALWDAQADTGFWIRAFALLAIVEQGTDVPLSAFDQVIAKTHPDLVANFFRRFVKKPTAASAYLARHAVKVLDGNGRLVALQIIKHRRDSQSKSYLEAATNDPDQTISRFAERALKARRH